MSLNPGVLLLLVSACGARTALAPSTGRDADVEDGEAMDASSPPDQWVPIAPVGDEESDPSDAGVDATCNPVQPYEADSTHTACPSNQRCDVAVPKLETTVCSYPAGPGTQDEQCGTNVDCAAGYDCVEVAQTQRCERYCRYGSAFDDCGSRYVCTPFVAPEYDGSQELGVCE